ncbi:MAG: sugar phosphate isomerase/epimerase [Lentisphaeria bacterium]|nr:sugar phosphate isomerase/epimerase [Lentisphaeria bacterium]
MKKYPIAIQIYSVRDELEKNFTETLKRVADIGYDGVEFVSRFGDNTPDQVADLMKSLGLKSVSLHTSRVNAGDPAFSDYDYAKALGLKTMICSGMKKDFLANFDTVSQQIRAVRDAAKTHGLGYAYHNHNWEFVKLEDGSWAYDKLVGDDVDVELDVYWLTQGGVDPVEYIKHYGQRLPLLHLKDRNPVTNTFTELGTGDVPLAKCVEALEGSKCEWLIYEQDICNYPSLESAKISYDNLKRILGY